MLQQMRPSLVQWKESDHTKNGPRNYKSESGRKRSSSMKRKSNTSRKMVSNTFSLFTPVPGMKAADSSMTISKFTMTSGTSEQKIKGLVQHGEKPTKKRMSKQFSSLLTKVKISTSNSLKIARGLPVNGALIDNSLLLECQLKKCQRSTSLLVTKVERRHQIIGMFSTTIIMTFKKKSSAMQMERKTKKTLQNFTIN